MAGLRWPVRPAAGALRAWGPRGPHRGKTVQAPRRPLPRTPWTTRGPPAGAPLPRSWQDKRPVQEQIPGLEQVTYAGKQHFVPWLARPRHPRWERGWHDPRHSPGPRYEEMPRYKERVCYVCHQRAKMLEGSGRGGEGLGSDPKGSRREITCVCFFLWGLGKSLGFHPYFCAEWLESGGCWPGAQL
ncbi:39S ribosomal protein L37, mitochondrial [Dermochelys coriacea]|uniref:39S ribosomal protein L37, mitochondrial n=1 Tax=Dermochelys coriacea TaxID=27794 RepID=UPI001CA800EF|nr:39S ribosomal protein L37, mitochondrial [Dermochelys coriacea]